MKKEKTYSFNEFMKQYLPNRYKELLQIKRKKETEEFLTIEEVDTGINVRW